ncbi:hypothetical protein GQ43DRAFT_473313 [Delitschia confertaspora ATCC 74209]|uniref:Xylanolytic transcriptional activator regulatory domain-containing protein n=1 Tax=Delitschia confertaspora ATCC 74209 TaxID=1513339 RepID=A0A9P4JK59_9PLEO|nr:hypothetical protein GQ43DRAFT_473313 [Delitschia confertaspora ATCC 74209]
MLADAKKGPKGSRAKVLLELRENQRQAALSPIAFSTSLANESSRQSTLSRTTAQSCPLLVQTCVQCYFSAVYPILPILHRDYVDRIVNNIDHSMEANCMILALCAFVIIQANMAVPSHLLPRPDLALRSNVEIGHYILDESIRLRGQIAYFEAPTHLSVLSSFLYYGCYFGLEKVNQAWAYLREATTLAVLLGMPVKEFYRSDPRDMEKKRALYWNLMLAERMQALHKHRPISLFATVDSPPLSNQDASDQLVATGFEMLTQLYGIFDDRLYSLWNNGPTSIIGMENSKWLTIVTDVQSQLVEAVPAYPQTTEEQAADLHVTQHWLRIMVWQISVRRQLVSGVAADSALSYYYPLEIARALTSVIPSYRAQALEVHGVGLIAKLFDVASCLIDVTLCAARAQATLTIDPGDYLRRFLILMSSLRGGGYRYLPLLLSRIANELPTMPLPQGLNLPQNVPASSSPFSPDIPAILPVDFAPGAGPSSMLSAQAGAQLPNAPNISQQMHSLNFAPPVSQAEDFSFYGPGTGPLVTYPSASARQSHPTTPRSYEATPNQHYTQPPSQSRAQPHVSGHPIQHSHSVNAGLQHETFQMQPPPPQPSQGYDPRYPMPDFPAASSGLPYQDQGGPLPGNGPQVMYQPPGGPSPSGRAEYAGWMKHET